MSGVVDGNKKDPGNTGSGFTPGGTTSQLLDGAGNAIDALPAGFVGADDILAALAGVAIDLGTSSGTANALAGASLVDTATTFTAGRLYRIRTNAANSGAATCKINGGTGVAMKKSPSSAALASGDIADATELLLFFDGTNLQVLAGLTVSATNIPGLSDGAGNANQSYNHLGGVGDRTGIITVTASVGLLTGSAGGIVNGLIYDTSQFFNGGLSASAHWIKFDFGVARKLTEAKWYQSSAVSQGTWKWQGSNDDSTYTDVGSSFTLGATSPQSQTSLNGNTTAYRYWKMVGVSGTTSSLPYVNECEFKLDDLSAVSATSFSVPGLAAFTGTSQFAAVPIWPRQTASMFFGAPAGGNDIPSFRYVTRADIGSLGLTPSDMPAAATSAGVSHAGDATYRNQYSLGAGTHYGFLFVTDELGSATIFTINGTTITLYANCVANVWSAGGATDRKARISAGAVQVQCGATFGAGYVSTFFLGTVR